MFQIHRYPIPSSFLIEMSVITKGHDGLLQVIIGSRPNNLLHFKSQKLPVDDRCNPCRQSKFSEWSKGILTFHSNISCHFKYCSI